MKPRVTTRAAVAIAAAAATGIAAAQPASVSGTMTIHGAPVALRHAIAQSYANPPGGHGSADRVAGASVRPRF